MILGSYISQNDHCYHKVLVQQAYIGDGDVRVETNNTEYPQHKTLSWNKLLSLSKVHHQSSSSSLSYAASSFNSMYKYLTLSFDSNISENKVSDMENKVSTCVDKVVSKLQLPT